MMLKNLKIRTKIILVPALAGIGFLLIFLINTFFGAENNQLISTIEEGYYPALEMSRELEDVLATIQRNMQYAVSAQDESALTESDTLRDRFMALLDDNKENRVLDQSDLQFIETEFADYYPLAKRTISRMLEGELDEEVIQSLDEMQTKYNMIQKKLATMTLSKKTDMANSIADAQSNQQIILITILIVTLLSILLQILVSIFFTKSITSPMQTIVQASNELARGNVDIELAVDTEDEIGDLAKSMASLVETTKNLTRTADSIGQGEYDVPVKVRSDEDILGHALSQMKDNLKKMTETNTVQDWLKTGQSELAEKIRGDQTVVQLSQNILNYTAKYIEAQVGAIYLLEDGDMLKLNGSYAYKRRKNLSSEFKLGEGLVGQCALEKKTILITDVPDDYIKINSGTGESKPVSILVTPLLYDGDLQGVIELGSFNEFTDIQMQFLEMASESIAIAFQSAVARTRVKDLLEETQNQAAELQAQQEELRVTNEELEEQTNNLRASEEELRKQQDELKDSNDNLIERQKEIEKKNSELEIARVEIERKANELEQSSKYKSEFLANMSHELRTPLNSIQILSKLLAENKEKNMNDKQKEFAKTINSSGSDLLNLINEILDLSKIEAGKMVINREEMSLSGFPNYLRQNFEHLAQEKSLYLKIDLNPDLPDSIITDRQRVEQIVKNMLSNAFKFTEKGGITVKIDRPDADVKIATSGLSHDNAVTISVSDTGIGIAKDKKDLIFQAFQQADGTTSRKYGGTGLGLSISLELAKLLGGEIQVTSKVGEGSTFALILPETLADTTASSKVATAEKSVEGVTLPDKPIPVVEKEESEQPKESAKVSDIRDDRLDIKPDDRIVLVIEDDANFAKILFDYTRERGYKCLIGEDGEAGLQLANQYKPSAILLDIGLPRIDGWTVMERLKNSPETRHIPVYFISGQDSKMAALNMGAVGYLTKPVDEKDLNGAFEKIETTLSKDIKKLLVVEDDDTMRESIMQLIGNGDISVTASGEGKHALQLLKKDDFDCMILDLGLSDISGFDLVEKIHKDQKIADLPIIIYTGKELSKKEETALRKHAESIIIKGAKSPDRLLDEVSLFLHRVEQSAPAVSVPDVQNIGHQDEALHDKKVLLVDDDVRNIFALSSVLEEKDMQISIAENGKDALTVLQQEEKIDIILMDIMMPEMDGYQAMAEIRKNKKFAKIPIIALTAKAMKGDRQKCISAGANDYLAKPIDVEKLLSLLQVWLTR